MQTSVRLFLLVLTILNSGTSRAKDAISAPQLRENSNYSEFWEAQFLFESGAYSASEFLITSFPLSKHHGLMISTLKPPQGTDGFGKQIIIKNGRKRSGWHYDGSADALNIYQHELSGRRPEYLLRLNNTAAEVDIAFKSELRSIPIIHSDAANGLPEVTLVAPAAYALGRWRAGPEIGGKGHADQWRELGHGVGYALHIVQDRDLSESLVRWQRFSSIPAFRTGGAADHTMPFLHVFTRPDDTVAAVLVLVGPDGTHMRFDNVKLELVRTGTWMLVATSDVAIVRGEIETTTPIEKFVLKDHLNGIERMMAGTLSTIERSRDQVNYRLEISQAGNTDVVSGTMIYEDITLEAKKERPRRMRR
ncbi:hypothetical protein [Kordiimonas aestuarii]|uniref:hypothetical protein n=1 Tax=Kordiimonas aestuarii TaxID=1005925 RepID=UPI0021CFEAE9|nr:hypothetical protein [Kordiimonas aestuarii]